MAYAYTGQGQHSAAQQTNAIQPKICNYCEQIIKEDEYETKPRPEHATCKLVLECRWCKESVHAKCASMPIIELKIKDKNFINWRNDWCCRICDPSERPSDSVYTYTYQLNRLIELSNEEIGELQRIDYKLDNLDFMEKYEEQLKINEEMKKGIETLKKEISSIKQEANEEIQSLENKISTMMNTTIKSNEPKKDSNYELGTTKKASKNK